ncbi:putative transcriptional regulator YheO [Sporosarcina luteola]|nr:putative transcriptional regulator YheO [Sporosarcina luteola]
MQENHQIFEAYKRIADAIYAVFSVNCEIVIHDTTKLESSLIYIKGDVTGRAVGAPTTEVILRELKKNPDDVQDLIGMKTNTKNGKILKSSTVFIRNERNEIIGFLGINFDVTMVNAVQQMLAGLVEPFGNADDPQVDESYATHIDEVFEQITNSTLVELGINLATITREERIRFVQRLDKKGMFLIQGSIDRIAELIGVSKQTIYNSLEEK